ncbi:hypothetical protein ACJZ2D_016272 [Fusarium nematophilum]
MIYDAGYQLLHTISAIKKFLAHLKQRGCSFDIVFFEDHTCPIKTKVQANRGIEEGLVAGTCQQDCGLYDRDCKLKQYNKCQSYRRIGT